MKYQIMNRTERDATARLALGRLFSMMQRHSQSGDVDMYHRIRAVVMENAPAGGEYYRPDYVRDRLKGAQGDS